MKLIVLNLPRDFTEDALEELFLPNGKIAACSIVTDEETGTSKGFGFVEMAYKKMRGLPSSGCITACWTGKESALSLPTEPRPERPRPDQLTPDRARPTEPKPNRLR